MYWQWYGDAVAMFLAMLLRCVGDLSGDVLYIRFQKPLIALSSSIFKASVSYRPPRTCYFGPLGIWLVVQIIGGLGNMMTVVSRSSLVLLGFCFDGRSRTHHQHIANTSPAHLKDFTQAALRQNRNITKHNQHIANTLLTHHQSITNTLPKHHRTITNTLPTYHQHITEASPTHHQHITNTSPRCLAMFFRCVSAVSGDDLVVF